MPFDLKKSVVLVGMMGAGKTAIGTALSKRLGVDLRDSDTEIVAASNMSIAEIFRRDGEPFFRRKEAQVIARLLSGPPAVLSTGGGAYLQQENRVAIHEAGVAVWLRADVDLLWSRVKHKNTRPLLMTGDPYATLVELCKSREPEYSKAELVVDAAPTYSIDDMTDRVVDVLLTRPDVLEKAT